MPFALEKMAELSEHFESCSSITKSNWVGRVVTYLGARTNKDAGPFDHLVFQDHVINLIRYIFTSTRPVVTRNGKVVVYCERHPEIHMTFWSHDQRGVSIVCTSPFSPGGGPPIKFSKRRGLTGSQYLEGVAGKAGKEGWFFSGGLQFFHKKQTKIWNI